MVTHERLATRSGTRSVPARRTPRTSSTSTSSTRTTSTDPKQATLVQNAIDSKVNGIAVTLSNADAVIPVAKKAADAGTPVVVFNQGFDQFKQAGSQDVLRLGRGPRRADHRHEDHRGRRRQGALCHPGAGLGGPGDPLRGREEDLQQHREHPGDGRRPAVGAGDPELEAAAGPVDHPRRHARRADRHGRTAVQGQPAQRRSSRSTSTRTLPRRSRTVRSSSRSTSSPMCRATWRSPGCG